MGKDLSKFLNDYEKKVPSTTFDRSEYTEPSVWFDTGDYGLNRIISGDIYRGIPSGRVTLFGGVSGSGKTLMVVKTIKNALVNGQVDHVFFFDSEGGAMKDMMEGLGVPTDKVQHVVVGSIEDANIKILNTFKQIEKLKQDEEYADTRFLIVFDSVGGTGSEKTSDDAEKNKTTSDMGLFAKICNNLVKVATQKSLLTDTAVILLNHVYDDPAAMYQARIKAQKGGKGLQFMPRVSIQCSKELVDNEDKKSEQRMDAAKLAFFTVKNSFTMPFFKTELFVYFKKGSLKYYGLLPSAMEYGFVEQHGAWYTVPSYSDKKLRLKEFINNDEIWETFLDAYNERSKQELAYANEVTEEDAEVDEIMNSEIDE